MEWSPLVCMKQSPLVSVKQSASGYADPSENAIEKLKRIEFLTL
jgi:hypothetical protein